MTEINAYVALVIGAARPWVFWPQSSWTWAPHRRRSRGYAKHVRKLKAAEKRR